MRTGIGEYIAETLGATKVAPFSESSFAAQSENLFMGEIKTWPYDLGVFIWEYPKDARATITVYNLLGAKKNLQYSVDLVDPHAVEKVQKDIAKHVRKARRRFLAWAAVPAVASVVLLVLTAWALTW